MLQSLQLERLAVYHDSDSLPWKIEKGWEDLSPEEWVEVCFYPLVLVSFGLVLCFKHFFSNVKHLSQNIAYIHYFY